MANNFLESITAPLSATTMQPVKSTKGSYFVEDPLINAIIEQESGGNPNAKSPKGAVGLMQLMEGTAKGLGLRVDDQVDERLDPEKNIQAGSKYYYDLLNKYNNDKQLALMAYNWGPGNVDNWISKGKPIESIPDETKNYVQRIYGKIPKTPAEKFMGVSFLPEVTWGGSMKEAYPTGPLKTSESEEANVALQSDLKNALNSFLNGIDQTQKSYALGKKDDYEKIIDEYPDRKSALDLAFNNGKITGNEYEEAIQKLEESAKDAQNQIVEYDKNIAENEEEILKNPVSRKYEYQNWLVQSQGSQADLWDKLAYSAPQIVGSSASLAGQQLAVTFGTGLAKKLLTAGLEFVAPEPVASKVAAATTLASALGTILWSRNAETYSEIGDAVQQNRELLLAKWMENHPGEEPSDEDLRQIRMQARKGKEDLYNENMALATTDLVEALLMPGNKLGDLFTSLSKPLRTAEGAIEKITDLNKFTRLGTTVGRGYLDYIGEKFEEGLQYAAQQRQQDQALDTGLYSNTGFIRNLLTDSKDVLGSLNYSPIGVIRNSDGRYSTDPNFQFSEESGGLLSVLMGGIPLAHSIYKDVATYRKISNSLSNNPFADPEEKTLRLKSEIYEKAFNTGTVGHLIEGIKNLTSQKDVNGNPLLSKADADIEISNIKSAYDKYKSINDYLNSIGGLFQSKEVKDAKNLFRASLFDTIIKQAKYDSELSDTLSQKSRILGRYLSKPEVLIEDLTSQILLRENLKQNILEDKKQNKDQAEIYDYDKKLEILDSQIKDLTARRDSIAKENNLSVDTTSEDFPIELYTQNSQLIKPSLYADLFKQRYAELKSIKTTDQIKEWLNKEKSNIDKKQKAFANINKDKKPEDSGKSPEELKKEKTKDPNQPAPGFNPNSPVENTVQQTGTHLEYEIIPGEEEFDEDGFKIYTVTDKEGNLIKVSEKEGFYKSNEDNYLSSDPRSNISNGVDHYLNPYIYNLNRERASLERISKTTGKTFNELLEEYPEAFKATRAKALYDKIIASADPKQYIDITVTRKFAEKNLNFSPIVFESPTGLIGLRVQGLSMMLRLTDPSNSNNVVEFAELYPPDYYALKDSSGNIVPINFADSNQMDLAKFNRLFRKYDGRDFTQEEFETFVRNWKSVKQFKVALETALKNVDLSEPALIPKEVFFLQLSGAFDWITEDKPFIKMTESPFLKEASIYYYDFNPATSHWVTDNINYPGFDMPAGTVGYYAVAEFPNGLKRWIKLTPAKLTEQERNTIVARSLKSVVDKLYDLDVNESDSYTKAKDILKELEFFIASFGDSRITPFVEQVAGKYVLAYKLEFNNRTAKVYFDKYLKDGNLVNYNYKFIEKRLNEVSSRSGVNIVIDGNNFRTNPSKDITEATSPKEIRSMFDITMNPNLIKSFSAKIVLSNNENLVSKNTPESDPTPAAPAPTPTQFTALTVPVSNIEAKIKEIVANSSFIELSEDQKHYVNTKTGKLYKRVTDIISDKFPDENNQLVKSSLTIGKKVDILVRDFFDGSLKPLEQYNISDIDTVKFFITQLEQVKQTLDKRGEIVLANNIVVYNDALGIAGTVDLLTYDSKGNINIYDMKTMRGNNFEESYKGESVNKYESKKFGKSKKEKYTEQLSLYRILLYNTHGVLAKKLAIMPLEVSYSAGDTETSKLKLLKGVSVTPLDKVKNAELVTETKPTEPAAPVSDIEKRKEEVRNIFKTNKLLAIHIIQNEKRIGSFDEYGRPNGELQDIIAVLKISVSEAQDLLKQYLNSGKPEGWKLGDEYDFSKYEKELTPVSGKKADIERRRQEELSKPFTNVSDSNPTLSNPEDLTDEEKKQKENGDNAINDAFRILENSDITYPVTLEEQEDYIASKLPKEFTRADLSTLHNRIAKNGITVGAVINNAIYLRDVADKGDLLHEAFHVVFRNLISDEKSRKYLDKVKRELNYSKEKLESEKARLKASGLYDNLTDDQLEDQVYEEYLADNYFEWSKGQEKKSWLAKLFEHIKNFIRYFLTDDIRGLYAAIDRGAFKNSSIIKTRFNSEGAVNSTYKLLYSATQVQSVNVVNQVLAKVFTDNMSVPQAINYFLEYYNPESEENQRLINSDPLVKQELERYETIFKSKANQSIIFEEVTKKLKALNLSQETMSAMLDDLDSDRDIDTNETPERQWDLSDAYVDPYSRAGRKIKSIIATTTYTAYLGNTGKTYQKLLDPRVFYSRMLPVLSITNTPSNKIMSKLKTLGAYDEQVKAFYERLMELTGYDHKTGEAHDKGRQILNALKKAFEVEQLVYLENVHNITDKQNPVNKIYEVNKVDLGDIFMTQWNNNWVTNVMPMYTNKKLIEKIIGNIQDFIAKTQDSEVVIDKNTVSTFKKNVLKPLGLDMEIPYLLYSFGNDDKSIELNEAFEGASKFTPKQLEVLIRVLKSKSNPFAPQSAVNENMYSTLNDIATANAAFSPNLILKTYPDTEGKTRYAYVASNDILTTTRELRQASKTSLESMRRKNNGYLKYNPIISSPEAQNILSNISIGLTGNFRIAKDETNPYTQETSETTLKGVTGKNLDPDTMGVIMHTLFTNTIQNQKTKIKYSRYWLSQISDKSTQYAVMLPNTVFWKDGFNELAKEKIFDLVKQEYLRNQGKFGQDLKKDKFLLFPTLSSDLLKLTEQEFNAEKSNILNAIEQEFKFQIDSYKRLLAEKKLATKQGFTFLNNDEIIKEYGSLNDYLGNFFTNHFIYTTGALQLYVGDIAWTKGWDDFVKRMAGGIASGSTLGESNFMMVHGTDSIDYLNPDTLETEESGAKNTNTDGQVYSTVTTKKYILDSLGELSPTLSSALDKVMNGEDNTLTKAEKAEIDFISDKLVGFGEDTEGREHYNKQSTAWLTKSLTSMKDSKGNWVAQPHREALHNLREYLEKVSENKNPVLFTPESSNKKYKSKNPVDINSFKSNIPEKSDEAISYLNGKYVRKQQENDTKSKDAIYFVRQLVDILGSEIRDEKTRKLVETFREDLAKLRQEAFDFASKLVANQVGNDYERADLTVWLDNIKHNIEVSTPDSQTLEYLSLPDVDFNLPHLSNKLKELFLNTFNTAFQKKVNGRKLTLISPFGFYVIEDKKTGRIISTNEVIRSKNSDKWKNKDLYDIRELRIHKGVKDNTEIREAEFLITRKTAEMMGVNISDPTKDDYMVIKTIGTRIPLQSYHMVTVGKIVDFLPDIYGDSIVGPKELVYLGGMDFDVDSLYVFLPNMFKNDYGETIMYGEEASDYERFVGYKKFLLKNNPYISREVNKVLYNDPDFKVLKLDPRMGEDLGEYSDTALILSILDGETKDRKLEAIIDSVVADVFKKFGYPGTVEEFINSGIESEGVIQNRLYNSMYDILRSPELIEAYKTPANHDQIEDSIKYLRDINAIDPLESVQAFPNLPVSINASYENSIKGKNLTGIAVNANTASSALTEYGVSLKAPIIFGEPYKSFDTSVKITRSKANINSTTVTGAVDNGNKPVSKVLNFSKYTIPERAVLISLGIKDQKNPDAVDHRFIDSFFALPVIKELINTYEGMDRLVSPLPWYADKEYKFSFINRVKRIYEELMTRGKGAGADSTLITFADEQNARQAFTKQDLEFVHSQNKKFVMTADPNSLSNNELKNIFKALSIQVKALQVYEKLSLIADDVQKASTILAANRRLTSEMNNLSMYSEAEKGLISENSVFDLDSLQKFLSDPNIRGNLENIKKIEKISKLFFLDHTDLFKHMSEKSKSNFILRNAERRQTLNRNFLSFITFKLLKNVSKKSYDDYYNLILPSSGRTIVNLYNELSKKDENGNPVTPEFFNGFTRALNVSPASLSAKNGIDIISIDSRTKFSTETIDMYMDSIEAMLRSSNPKIKEFATSLIKYLMIKDSLQFRSGSFIKYLPSNTFYPISTVLKRLNTSIAYENIRSQVIKELTGNTTEELLKEFNTIFGTQAVNKDSVKPYSFTGDPENDSGIVSMPGGGIIPEGNYKIVDYRFEGTKLTLKQTTNNYAYLGLSRDFKNNLEALVSGGFTINFPTVIKVNGSNDTVYIEESRTTSEAGLASITYTVFKVLNTRGVLPYAASIEATRNASLEIESIIGSKKDKTGANIKEGAELSDAEITNQNYSEAAESEVIKPTKAPVSTQPTVELTNLPGPETKINIYAGTGENAELSNFAIRPFEYNTKTFPRETVKFQSVEQAFQFMKLGSSMSSVGNESIANKILETTSGAELKKLGKKFEKLNTEKWNANSSRIMKELLKASFEQNPDALAKLLATGNAELTHTQDKGKWGTQFPKLLMEVREELSKPLAETKVSEIQENTITLKDGKTYTYDQVNSKMLTIMKYTPAEIGEIIKKLCK